MYALRSTIARIIFSNARSHRIGRTVFRDSRVEIEQDGTPYTLIEVAGPNSTLAFDLLEFEDWVRDVAGHEWTLDKAIDA